MVTKEIVKRRWYNEKKVVIVCDRCGSEHTSRSNIKRCLLCGKDVCLGCAVNVGRNPRMWHGYDRWCCEICWAAGKDCREVLEAAEDVFSKVIEDQFAIWGRCIGGVENGK